MVCRVERTHAVFPLDPFTKTMRKIDGGNVVKVSWKAPTDPSVTKWIADAPLRLGTGLRPPMWSDAGPWGDVKVPLAPIFFVVTFPCKLTPFVVPFARAYTACRGRFGSCHGGLFCYANPSEPILFHG